MTIFRYALIIGCAALAASFGARAVGFGQVSPSAVLGQPLNVLVLLKLDQGERMFSECVRAEVLVGELPLNPSQIRVAVLPTSNPAEWTARITTMVPIEEPVVEVAVSAGCDKRFMRRFTALADPPEMDSSVSRVATTAPVVASSLNDVLPLTRPRRPLAIAVRRGPTRGMSEPSVKLPRERARSSLSADVVAPGAQVTSVVPRNTQVARLLLDVAGPQLRMDLEDPVFMPAVAVPGAASGVAGAMDSDVGRLQLLEKTLGDLRRETQASRDTETGMKSRLAEAESRSRALPWLLGLLLLATSVAVWLAVRLRGQARTVAVEKREAQPSWWTQDAVAGSTGGPVPEPPSSVAGELIDLPQTAKADRTTGPSSSGARAVPDALPLEAPHQTRSSLESLEPSAGPAPAGLTSIADGGLPMREVTVEELLDLEQQADFFIALGQEDAAVDLLMSHLRGTGGLSPLPYTKLLEIYRRQGDRSAYERMRARFNRRFNVYAPEWDVGPLHGRTLEEYPEVVTRLQGLWTSPLNSMAVLEAMLFRNDERQELLDLPAYKDVLLLYSLARDLYQQDGLDPADVDLLLPLGDDQGTGSTGAVLTSGTEAVQNYDVTSFTLDASPPVLDQIAGKPPS